jgi:GntR family transcriptional regulator
MVLSESGYENPCELKLLGCSEGVPVVFYDSILRKSLGIRMYETAQAHEKEKHAFSTFDLYKDLGMEIGKINQRILAVNANRELSELLKIDAGDALLVLESMIFSKEMMPMEYKKAYYRTDKYSFNLYREL